MRGVTVANWWVHEARRCGRQAFVLPVLAALVAGATTATGQGSGMLLSRSLLTCAVPMATALACAAVVAREPMAELHLSLSTPYRRTVARRLAWPAAVTAVAAVALVNLPAAGDLPLDAATALVELAGLTVLLSGCAVWATVRTGSAAPAAGLVSAAVLAKLLLVDRVVPAGLVQAVPALLVGAVLTALALRGLGPDGRPDPNRRTGPGQHNAPTGSGQNDARPGPGEAW
ncbi:hypothetical protein QIS99_21125 [Streptomyces sp. B-S-A8]|uniref:Uncharacterized protein n=1 Tax=Streptomyces solicavernae TaxID=3043614 RepID=A0ABT6RY46_9ACTN|nr:hypothetical protein [Streptomyces sp. B-S-A8]MDI3388688.1 hypothetical protein [Streptomyces sp. B-S-A8]